MPSRPRKPCVAPRCPNLTTGRYCETHQRQSDKRRRVERSTLAAFYDSARWRRFRRWFLAGHPLCEDCQQQDRVTPAAEVHHREKVEHRPDLGLVEDNVMALCKPCHSRRTARGE